MMPNVPQYPVAVAAILRAGFVVVNVNPLYTPRELEHQLKDSGAKAIVIIENFATTLQQCIANTPVKHVVLAAMGDQLGPAQGRAGQLRGAQRQEDGAGLQPAGRGALQRRDRAGRARHACSKPEIEPDDVAVLQYTGGTTGVSKGAVLLHRNVIANVLQSEAWNEPVMDKVPAGEQPTSVCALPLYHIFAFTVNMMLSHAHRRQADPDPESARPAGACSRSCRSTPSTASRRSTRCSTGWPTTPTSAPSTGRT